MVVLLLLLVYSMAEGFRSHRQRDVKGASIKKKRDFSGDCFGPAKRGISSTSQPLSPQTPIQYYDNYGETNCSYSARTV